MTRNHDSSRYMVVSADGHAGADIEAYRSYLDRTWRDEFDDWADSFHDPWVDLDPGFNGRKIGVSSAVTPTNWDSRAREADLRSQGVVGEVLFPNTSPPFFPSGVITAPGPTTRAEYERRAAGLRAHNRWLVDFCNELPGRRAGVAQVFLNDVDDAVAEVEWLHDSGLTGGILIPQVEATSGLPPLHAPAYDRLWSSCAANDVPIGHHGAIPGLANDDDGGTIGRLINAIDFPFHSIRMLWQLIMSGVFERHPNLRFVMTELPIGWIPGRLELLDYFWNEAQEVGSRMHSLHGASFEKLPLRPSEYFHRNCFVGASFMLPSEVKVRSQVGVDRIMWGADYPHGEGTTPYTKEALRATFAEVSSDECRAMFGETAAEIYQLDVELMRNLADEYGPRVDEVAEPLLEMPRIPEDTNCRVFELETADRF